MMQKFIWIFIFHLELNIAYAWRSYTLISRNITADIINPDYLNGFHIGAEQHGTKLTSSVNFTLIQNLDKGFIAQFLAYEMKDDEFVPNFINTTLNICDYYKKPASFPLVHLVYPILLKHGNFPKRCPIKKGFYEASMPDFDSEKLPPYLPGEDWLLEMIFYDGDILILRAKWFLKLDHKKTMGGLGFLNRAG